MNALTTLKLTSASSSASRISRSAVSTCSGVSRTSPRSDWKTSWMRVLSDSNMEAGTYGRAKPNAAQTLILGEVLRAGKSEGRAVHMERRTSRSGAYTDESLCPSLSFLVFRYLRVESVAGISSGTASETASP